MSRQWYLIQVDLVTSAFCNLAYQPQDYIIVSSLIDIMLINRWVMNSVDGDQTRTNTPKIPSQMILYLVIWLSSTQLSHPKIRSMFNGSMPLSSLATITYYLAHFTLNIYLQLTGHVLRLRGYTSVISTIFVYLKLSFHLPQVQSPWISKLSATTLVETAK